MWWQITAVAVFSGILVVAGVMSSSWVASAIVAVTAGIIIGVPVIRAAVVAWLGLHWRIIFLPIVGLAVASLLIAVYSPAIKKSMGRWHGNVKQTIANALDKKSLKSEPEMGTLATINRRCPIIGNNGQPLVDDHGNKVVLNQGDEVLVLSLESWKSGKSTLGMVYVMGRDANDLHINGPRGFVPIANLDWHRKKSADHPRQMPSASAPGTFTTPRHAPPVAVPLPAPVPHPTVVTPAPSESKKNVTYLPTYNLCVGSRGECLGDFKYDDISNAFYSEDGRVKMIIKCINSSRRGFISGEGMFAGDRCERPFRAFRLTY